ncbi:MAG: iron ABC transporter ATP-binding protein [Anaerolineae bacterium]|jgi:ABC-type Fe3+/spermidine/putrescine transport system ATPase subunit|nr:MAG: iron ABC transporter ATP-binding protein [Anaerolineae bacterium]
MEALVLQNVSKALENQQILHNISFKVELGEIVALLGPSGCGKSTTLAVIAGLLDADQGEIFWKGQSLRGIPPHQRNFGLMFQDLALFPHLNVFENIAFGLRMRKLSSAQIQQRVQEMLVLVNLQGFERRDVANLSGGEMQRVALARALAPQPQLLMLDEPLASLDRTLRDRLALELRHILRQMNQTAIYVTHDQEEAFTVADRIILMKEGKIEQTGTPHEIYQKPVSPFVAQFLGMKNLVEAEILYENGQSWLSLPWGKISHPSQKAGKGLALIRPTGAVVDGKEGLQLKGKLVQKVFRGDHCLLEVQCGAELLSFSIPCSMSIPPENETLTLTIRPESILFFAR